MKYVDDFLRGEPVIAGIAAQFVVLVVVAFGLDIPRERVAAMGTIMGLLAIGVAYLVRWSVSPVRKRKQGE